MSHEALTSEEGTSSLIQQQQQKHRVHPQGVALAVVVVTVLLLSINTLIVGLRIYVRAWYLKSARIWGWDDTLAVLGFLFYLCASIFSVLCAFHGIGGGTLINANMLNAPLKYYYCFQTTYCLAIAGIKSSLCVGLSRLTSHSHSHSNRRCYGLALLGLVASWAVCGLVALVCVVSFCGPPSAEHAATAAATLWGANKAKACYSGGQGGIIIGAVTYTISSWAIVTDLACSFIPWLLLWRLQMTRRTKWSLVGAVVASCAVASVGSVMIIFSARCYYTAAPVTGGESASKHIPSYASILFWSQLESGFGLAAGSVPPLGKLLPLFNHRPRKAFRISDDPVQGHVLADAATDNPNVEGNAAAGERMEGIELRTLPSDTSSACVSGAVVGGWTPLDHGGGEAPCSSILAKARERISRETAGAAAHGDTQHQQDMTTNENLV